jgi:hypothetical protein
VVATPPLSRLCHFAVLWGEYARKQIFRLMMLLLDERFMDARKSIDETEEENEDDMFAQ